METNDKKSENIAPLFIGSRLKFIRIYNNMTCQGLADVCGLSKQAISKYETGAMNPSNKTFLLFCEVFKMNPSFFTHVALNVRLQNNKIIIQL